jgi:NADH:ubiquinone oxidoreductase subunit F (NADH-binding)
MSLTDVNGKEICSFLKKIESSKEGMKELHNLFKNTIKTVDKERLCALDAEIARLNDLIKEYDDKKVNAAKADANAR